MKKILIIFLVATFLFNISATAETKVMTGTNDKILEYKKGYEPIFFGGQIYVPYTVFFEGLDVMGYYNSDDNVLILYNFDHIITFDISGKVVRDETLTVHKGEAFFRSNILYVPAETVCKIFNFELSKIDSTVKIVRITNGNHSLSDEVFTTLTIEEANRKPIVEESDNNDDEIVIPPTVDIEDEIDTEYIASANIYPVFLGAFTEKTQSVIDRLGSNTTTFFIDDTANLNSEILRYIYVNNHNIGIFVPTSEQTDIESMLNYINSVNNIIFETLNFKTRMIITENNFNDFNDDLNQNGYINYNVAINNYNKNTIIGTKNKIIDLTNTNAINDFVKFCNDNQLNIKKLNEFN